MVNTKKLVNANLRLSILVILFPALSGCEIRWEHVLPNRLTPGRGSASECRVEPVGCPGGSGKPGIGSYLVETAMAAGQSSVLL